MSLLQKYDMVDLYFENPAYFSDYQLHFPSWCNLDV